VTGAAGPLSGRLAGCELVIFDKDGTLIDFGVMWAGWMAALATDLERAATALDRAIGSTVVGRLYQVMGVDRTSGIADPHGALAATPMAILRRMTVDTMVAAGLAPSDATAAVGRAWLPPDPVALARPLTDLAALFGSIRAAGARIGVATSDDREPTERSLRALGVADLIDALVCADDGIPVKPAPDAIRAICDRLSIAPSRAAMIGDSALDLAMGRAAGVARCIGVLSGTGTRAELEPYADAIVPSVAALMPAA
jgi:phosphoglycolate phosphatase